VVEQRAGIGAELDEAERARLRGPFDAVYVLGAEEIHWWPDLRHLIPEDPRQVAIVLVRRAPGGGVAYVSQRVSRALLADLLDPEPDSDGGLLEHLHAVAEDEWAAQVAAAGAS